MGSQGHRNSAHKWKQIYKSHLHSDTLDGYIINKPLLTKDHWVEWVVADQIPTRLSERHQNTGNPRLGHQMQPCCTSLAKEHLTNFEDRSREVHIV